MQKISPPVLDGKNIAQEIINELKGKGRPKKILAAILVGNNPASLGFIKQKKKIAQELGIKFQLYQFNETVSEEDLVKEIKKLGDDKKIGGIIIQLPLPVHFNRDRIISAINPQKDIDALNPESKKYVLPPSVEVVKEILQITNYQLRNKVVAVVGAKGILVGRPVSEWLEGRCKKLILLDIGDDLSRIKEADLVITGVGKAGLIKPEMLKNGAGVIDFGYSFATRINTDKHADSRGKISGDFDANKCQVSDVRCQVSFYTPTPGGTGPILVAELFRNFYILTS